MRNTLLALCLFSLASILPGCASSEQQSMKADAQTKVQETEYLPPVPKLFGVSMTDHPMTVERRLEQLGFHRTTWMLDAPYSHMVFQRTSPDTAEVLFDQVEILVCNKPQKTASIVVHGTDRAAFYKKVKDRFLFTVQDMSALPDEAENQAKQTTQFKTYRRFFSCNARDRVEAILQTAHSGAKLTLSILGVEAYCKKALHNDLEVMQAEQAMRSKKAREDEQNSF